MRVHAAGAVAAALSVLSCDGNDLVVGGTVPPTVATPGTAPTGWCGRALFSPR